MLIMNLGAEGRFLKRLLICSHLSMNGFQINILNETICCGCKEAINYTLSRSFWGKRG